MLLCVLAVFVVAIVTCSSLRLPRIARRRVGIEPHWCSGERMEVSEVIGTEGNALLLYLSERNLEQQTFAHACSCLHCG
jgi:hypothetical protein